MRHDGTERHRGACGQVQWELVDVFDHDIGTFSPNGALDRPAAQQGKAVPSAHPFYVDSLDRGPIRSPGPPRANQSNPVALQNEAAEYFEEMDFRATGVGICSILPVHQEDIHRSGGLVA
jgi:hypothetical protein